MNKTKKMKRSKNTAVPQIMENKTKISICRISEAEIEVAASQHSTKMKPRRSVSEVWKYFKKMSDSKYAQCKLCSKVYKTSGNTSNLMDHLKRAHREDTFTSNDMEITMDTMENHSTEDISKPITIKSEECMEGRTGMSLTELWQYLDNKNTSTAKIKEEQSVGKSSSINSQSVERPTSCSTGPSGTAKRPKKPASEAWMFFEKISKNYAQCRLCSKLYRSCGNTTNLLDHLARAHPASRETSTAVKNLTESSSIEIEYAPEESYNEMDQERPDMTVSDIWTSLENEEYLEYDKNLNEMEESGKRRKMSEAWKYFRKFDTYAECILCSTIYKTSGNTTNLFTHLKSAHPNFRETPLPAAEEHSSDNTKIAGKKPSAVWKYFNKSATPKFAKCRLCSKLYRTSGNTTNLLAHLKSAHPKYLSTSGNNSGNNNTVLTDDVESDNEICNKLEPMVEIKCEDIFEETAYSQFAKCRLCSKLCRTSDDKSHLLDHLRRAHPTYQTTSGANNEMEESKESTDNKHTSNDVESNNEISYESESEMVFEVFNDNVVYFEEVEGAEIEEIKVEILDSYKNDPISCEESSNSVKNAKSYVKVDESTENQSSDDLDLLEEMKYDPASDTGKRIRYKSSAVMALFKPVDDTGYAECRFCAKQYRVASDNVKNLTYHIKSNHPEHLDVILKTQEDYEEDKAKPKKPRKKHKPRLTSEVWSFFDKTEDGLHGKCRFCGKLVKHSGNTSNYHEHLKRVHPTYRDENLIQTDTQEYFLQKAAVNDWNLFQKKY
ncbi:uncharacterized protein [Musca autumnalis]|uniref:uncharacterized protein n=1 Tax=Musca autumnalis TaxID=221902 RepID=UPI003CF8E0D6